MKTLVFLLVWAGCVAAHAAPLTITGDDGATLSLDAAPQRIISLAPNLTELAYAAGLGSRMVAVTAYSDYPDAARKLPLVGDVFHLDWERIVALKPDLVLAWASSFPAADRARFAQMKLKALVLEPRRLDDIPRALRLLGQAGDATAQAEAAARSFERHREALRDRYASRPTVRVWFQIAADPLLTVNGDHIVSDVLRLCGAENVFADAPLLTPAISEEALVQARPQLLLGDADTPELQKDMLAHWRRLPLAAAREGRMAFIPPDLISRASPRILQGAERICGEVERVR
ncbi:MAG: cobalamin-binding protein [Gallionellaceae bacterium]|jgi:iron complex transport system substrate-binding protein|nr:cobalamin-binding protein [Gallionellaceae bacterium]